MAHEGSRQTPSPAINSEKRDRPHGSEKELVLLHGSIRLAVNSPFSA
jgi:hypothetical protein